jgi:HEAT repeat protein
MAHDKRPAVRETALYLLGIIGSSVATPVLTEALNDPVPAVRLQAAKALGRVGDPTSIPALLTALRGADEQLGSNIFSALVRMGHEAVPPLIERSSSSSAWMRWNSMRALSEICDQRALPVLVQALLDTDHSVVWMAAKGLVGFGRVGLGPLLRLLMNNETSPWLVEAASYVMREMYLRDPKLKSYLEPVIHSMHRPAFRVATPIAAQKALAQLTTDGLVTT